MGRPRQAQVCCSWKCRREIQPDEKGIAITMFGQTLGMGKMRTSKSERLYLCPQCAAHLATDTVPPRSAPVDLAFFKVTLDLAGKESCVAEAMFEQLQQRRQDILYPIVKALTEGEVLPPVKSLKAAS